MRLRPNNLARVRRARGWGGAGSGPATSQFSAVPQQGSDVVLSNGNLTAALTNNSTAKGADPIPAGSYYFEMTTTTLAAAYTVVGIGVEAAVGTSGPGWDTNHSVSYVNSAGQIGRDGQIGSELPWGAAPVTVGVKVVVNGDDTGTIAFTLNGTNYTAEYDIGPVLAFGPIYPLFGTLFTNDLAIGTANFGGSAYAFGLPVGFSNIPTSSGLDGFVLGRDTLG